MFELDELVGMSAYIAIDEGRGVLEIGNTYIVSEKRGTGFNRMVKQLMIDRAFSCGFRRIEFRVERKSVGEGKRVAVRVDLGCSRRMQNQKVESHPMVEKIDQKNL